MTTEVTQRRGNMGLGSAQCLSVSFIFPGMPVATVVPQQVFSAESLLPHPITAQTHTQKNVP